MELTEFHKDALKESVNVGIGKAAALLSSLVEFPIEFSIPELSFVHLDSIKQLLDDNYDHWSSCIIMKFDGGFGGHTVLIFDKESASGWIRLIGQAQFDATEDIMPEMEADLLLEVGNIIINGCIGSIANLLKTENHYEIPHFFTRFGSEIFDDLLEDDQCKNFGIIINTKFKLENEEIATELVITLKEDSVPKIVDLMMELV